MSNITTPYNHNIYPIKKLVAKGVKKLSITHRDCSITIQLNQGHSFLITFVILTSIRKDSI
uniref:Uncharacterized protein n=1 Tax=Physcomitrium patens TaxID=3218 RepID=A0A2K1IGW7_PHYPA|nr:hypothetical protein PHYPA_029107 [Physcomitrium patens]